jgi:hypothetical protein
MTQVFTLPIVPTTPMVVGSLYDQVPLFNIALHDSSFFFAGRMGNEGIPSGFGFQAVM